MLRFFMCIVICFLKISNFNTSCQTTMSMLKLNDDFYCALANNTHDSALLWQYQSTGNTPSNTIFCNIQNGTTCDIDNLNKTWSWREDFNYSPILDHRWEDMPTVQVSYLKPITVYKPKQESFRISFSFKGNEVHIFLCDSEYITSSSTYGSCYWIGINANDGTENYLRKCVGDQIPAKIPSSVSAPCSTSGITSPNTGGRILDKFNWKHFSISKKGDRINVWQYSVSEPVLQFKDDSNDTYKVTHVIVRSAMFKDGFMKVHKVMTLYSANPANASIMLNEKSTPSCLALYVRMCKDCAFHITTASAAKVYTREMVENATENWQRIVLKNNASERITEISIRTVEKATSKNEKFWFISDTIQGCNDDVISIMKGNKGCCYALKYSRLSACPKDIINCIVEDKDWECPTNTIGKNCLPCNILGKENCGSGKIYYTSENNTFCSCSAGYKMNPQSKDCTDQCLPGTYGHNCKRQCGRCANKTCNNVDGSCECEVNFIGKTCNQPILPIVKKAPTLIMAQQQKLQINLNLEYDGQLTATHYQIQYKQQGREWRNGIKSEYQSAQGTLDVNDLTPNTNYWIRVILHVKDNRVYDGNHIPILITKTVCADLNKPSIYLTQLVTSNSTSVAVMDPRKEVCHPLSQFRVCLSREFMLECHTLDNTASFNDLDYYTDYKVELQKNEITTSTWTIQTNEGPPEQVQNIRHGKTTDTNIELVWDVPKKKNGKIMGYRVKYYRTSNKACPNMTQVESQSNTINVEGNSALIDNLEPYSTYEALIWAFTTYEGSPNTFKFDTMESSTLMKQEFPKPTYTSSKDTLNVHFQWNCSTWGGPAIFAVNLVCKSPWCNGSTEEKLGLISSNTSLPKSLKFSTISYTNYTVMMSLERNNVSISKNSLFRKGPSEPGSVRNITVYTKSNTSASLRWLPPYPPKGEVEYYRIKYRDFPFQNETDTTYKYIEVSNTSKCKLWLEQICYTLTDLQSSHVYISIRAKNINVTKYGEMSEVISVETKEEVSEPPKNLSLEWDDGYNLTIRWEHPDRTNGRLLEFQISVNEEMQLTYHINNEQLNYEYKLNIENTNFTLRQLNIEVKAKNSAGISNPIKISIQSPPKRPIFTRNPIIKNITNFRFTLEIPEILGVEGNKSNMYIVISDINNEHTLKREYIHSLERKLLEEVNISVENSWIANAFNLYHMMEQKDFFFEVGDDSETVFDETWKLKNRKLNVDRTYSVTFVLLNTYGKFSRASIYKIPQPIRLSESAGRLYYLLMLLLIPIILSILYVLLKRRHCAKRYPQISSSANRVGRYIPGYRRFRRSENQILLTQMVLQNMWPAVEVNNLHSYIRECISNNDFEKQFEAVPCGQTKPWVSGTIPNNRPKNRFTNLAAYDHTRVKLETVNGNPLSDYINANYIDGYKMKKAYIATQGPKDCTVNDFWRMIWQEEVEYIVMLANIVESGKKKVEKYWPEITRRKKFGSIVVQYVTAKVTANYEVRTFYIFHNREKRRVRQYHYVNWPEGGVPLHFNDLVPFCREIANLQRGKSPIVVHSSVGIGRTGTFILCDICLCMAKVKRKVDVFRNLRKLREQRVNMVDNVQQYILVHFILLRSLLEKDTGILCDKRLENTIENVTEAEIEDEMNLLEDVTWQNKTIRASKPNEQIFIDQEKNRFKNILPDSDSAVRLSLYPPNNESSTYINAVLVDSYEVSCKFIVTQNPLSCSVPDFWRMIEENHVKTIVSLNYLDFNDLTTTTFYPLTKSFNIVEPLPYLEVRYVSKEIKNYYEIFNLELARLDIQENAPIKIIQINNWYYNMMHPEDPHELIKVYEEMNHLSVSSDKIVLTCYDGARASGLFAALCILIDRIKLEQICDVSLAVGTVRQSRKQFVRDASQFSFLHRCALEFVRAFDAYSNFDRSN